MPRLTTEQHTRHKRLIAQHSRCLLSTLRTSISNGLQPNNYTDQTFSNLQTVIQALCQQDELSTLSERDMLTSYIKIRNLRKKFYNVGDFFNIEQSIKYFEEKMSFIMATQTDDKFRNQFQGFTYCLKEFQDFISDYSLRYSNQQKPLKVEIPSLSFNLGELSLFISKYASKYRNDEKYSEIYKNMQTHFIYVKIAIQNFDFLLNIIYHMDCLESSLSQIVSCYDDFDKKYYECMDTVNK